MLSQKNVLEQQVSLGVSDSVAVKNLLSARVAHQRLSASCQSERSRASEAVVSLIELENVTNRKLLCRSRRINKTEFRQVLERK